MWYGVYRNKRQVGGNMEGVEGCTHSPLATQSVLDCLACQLLLYILCVCFAILKPCYPGVFCYPACYPFVLFVAIQVLVLLNSAILASLLVTLTVAWYCYPMWLVCAILLVT